MRQAVYKFAEYRIFMPLAFAGIAVAVAVVWLVILPLDAWDGWRARRARRARERLVR